jgi:hypothetical protein
MNAEEAWKARIEDGVSSRSDLEPSRAKGEKQRGFKLQDFWMLFGCMISFLGEMRTLGLCTYLYLSCGRVGKTQTGRFLLLSTERIETLRRNLYVSLYLVMYCNEMKCKVIYEVCLGYAPRDLRK